MKKYTLIAIAMIIVLMVSVLGACSSAKTQSQAGSQSADNKVTVADKGDAIDPENIEPELGEGESVHAEDLSHKTGSANGIDVSKWQGKIDWQAVGRSGIDFAIIRVGYRAENGVIYKDQYADYNLQQAAKAGILTGVYFFSTAVSKAEAIEEAKFTVAAIAGYAISYPVVYDCEGFQSPQSRMYGIGNAQRTDIALAFMNEVRNSGYEPMLYAAKNELEGEAYWDTARLEQACLIWVARYTNPPYPTTVSPDYSSKYDMWQYTNRGAVNGISGNTDMIVSYFTRSKAAAKDGSKRPAEAEVPSNKDDIYTAINESVTAKELTNLRDIPSTKGNIVATLKNGTFITRVGTGSNGWSKLQYNGQTVYAISSYLTTDKAYSNPDSSKADIVANNTFTPVNEQVTAKDTVNLRSEPTTSGNLIAALKNGTFVTRTAVSDKGWSRLVYNGQTVYAVTSFLTTDINYVAPSSPETSSSDVSKTMQTEFTPVNEQVTAKTETNLRSAPSTVNSQVIYLLKNGEFVTRTGIGNNGWSRLDYNGQTVYAVSSYLQ